MLLGDLLALLGDPGALGVQALQVSTEVRNVGFEVLTEQVCVGLHVAGIAGQERSIVLMMSAWPTMSMRPKGQTAERKMMMSATAESRRTSGVQRRPKPMVNSATPAMGTNTCSGIPKVRKGFSSTRGLNHSG